MVAPGSGTATPLLKKVKSTDDGIRVAWGKVKKADRYVIYRRKGNGSLKKVRTVSGSTKAWTDRNVSQGIRYSYAVKSSEKRRIRQQERRKGSGVLEAAAENENNPEKQRHSRDKMGEAGTGIRLSDSLRGKENDEKCSDSGSCPAAAKPGLFLRDLGRKRITVRSAHIKMWEESQYTSPWSAVKRIAKK